MGFKLFCVILRLFWHFICIEFLVLHLVSPLGIKKQSEREFENSKYPNQWVLLMGNQQLGVNLNVALEVSPIEIFHQNSTKT